jgi:hypothetical protein
LTLRRVSDCDGEGPGPKNTRTFVEFKVGDGLPLVRSDEPPVVLAATREVDDELSRVAVERAQDGAQAVHGKGRLGKQIRRDDDLLQRVT